MADNPSRARIGLSKGRWQLRVHRRTESGLEDHWLSLGEVEDPEIALRVWLGPISGDHQR